jgi:hypothetical protein
MKSLNRIASEALQFESLYRPFCLKHNFCVRPRPFLVETRSVPVPLEVPSRPSRALHNELNSLASQLLQFGTLYHETSIPVGPRPHEFLKRTKSPRSSAQEEKDNVDSLKELNRLARLYEQYPDAKSSIVYPQFTTKEQALHFDHHRYGKGLPNPFVAKIRSQLKLDSKSSFRSAFPGFSRPATTLSNGRPECERQTFNTLLAFKASQLRNVMHTPSTPYGFPRHLAQWITNILKNPEPSKLIDHKIPTPRTKKEKQSRTSTVSRTKIDFQPAEITSKPASPSADPEPVDQRSPSPTPPAPTFSEKTKYEHVYSSTTCRISNPSHQCWNCQHAPVQVESFLEFSAPLPHSDFSHFEIREARLLIKKVKNLTQFARFTQQYPDLSDLADKISSIRNWISLSLDGFIALFTLTNRQSAIMLRQSKTDPTLLADLAILDLALSEYLQF